MKRLKKGFTLIELLVVIAIIGILVTILAPKLIEQLAKAKDAKAIALLGSARMVTGVILMEKVVLDDINKNGYIMISLEEIKDRLDKKSEKIFKSSNSGNVIVGSILNKNNKIEREWEIYLFGTRDKANNKNETLQKLKNNNSKLKISGDEAQLKLMVKNKGRKNKAKSTEGKLWTTY